MLTKISFLEVLSDATLIRHYLCGSNLALAVLISRYNPSIKKYLHLLLHNTLWEEEALQELWKKVIELLENRKYRERGLFGKWLSTRAFWTAKGIARNNRRYIPTPDDELPDEAEENPEDDFPNKEYVDFFKKELAKMNAKVQEIVKLRTEEDMPFHEIDDTLGLKRGSSAVNFGRTTSKLYRLFIKTFTKKKPGDEGEKNIF